jgi:hypothetical protein
VAYWKDSKPVVNYDTAPRDLEKVSSTYAFLGRPPLTESVIADLADLTGVAVSRIVTFIRYGRLN